MMDMKRELLSNTDPVVDRIMKEQDDAAHGDAQFAHVCVFAGIDDVLQAVADIVPSYGDEAFNDITKRREFIPHREVFIWAHPTEQACLLWHHEADTKLVKELSRILMTECKLISIYEPMRCWEFVQFSCGEIVFELLDPEQVWRTNEFTAELLMGKGHRQFPTLASFLQAIQKEYSPIDQYWNFARWREFARTNERETGKSTCGWAIEIEKTGSGINLNYVGEVPDFAHRVANRLS